MKKLLIVLLVLGACKKESKDEPTPVQTCYSCPYEGSWRGQDSIVYNVTVQAAGQDAVDVLMPFSSTWIRATAVSSWDELLILGQNLYGTDSMQNETVHGYVWLSSDKATLFVKIERDYWNYSQTQNHHIELYSVACKRQ